MNHTPPPFSDIEQIGGRVLIAGYPVSDLARTFGTPLYVYDGGALERRIDTLKFALSPRFSLLYSLKANAHPEVLRRAERAGLGIDACSPGDVHLALRGGVQANRISYTGVALSASELGDLAEAGVHVNLDSLEEVTRWASVAPGRSVGLRISPEISAGFHPHCQAGIGGKFGLPISKIPAAVDRLGRHGCAVTNLHAHVGSSLLSAAPHLEALDILLALAETLPSVRSLNLGGGLSAHYHMEDEPYPVDELRQGCVDRLDRFQARTGRLLGILLEPGEYLVSEIGWLVCEVRVTKVHASDRCAIVNASANHLPAPMAYGSYVHIYVDGKEGLERAPWDVFGNTNQAGDRFARGRSLPDLAAGDLLLFRNAGAYAASRSTRFNERPRAPEVWLERGEARLIRRGESLEALLDGVIDQ